jgi:NADPH-dependent 2,4-dienoyl-CoA reductase/sulfur reductase-like enzyme
MDKCDIAVIGAGPAGMAAATSAAGLGLSVTLLDEQPAAGGQVWRAVEAAAGPRGALLGRDFTDGLRAAQALAASGARHVRGATVWKIEADGTLAYSVASSGRSLRTRRVILATGALERPVPLPGWTLPGVMTAGAAQILLKQSGLAPARAVIAGCGPLVYLLAQQLIRAGRPPLALVETQTAADFRRALAHLPGALRGWRQLAKGAAMLRDIRRAGVPRYQGATGLRIEGADHAEALRFTIGGAERRIAAATILLHQGVVPNTQATRSLRLPHRWDAAQRCFSPETDPWGRTALEAIYVAGDGAGIGGADAAGPAGRLAALDAACALGALDAARRDALAAPERAARARALAARPFLDAAYPPSHEALRHADEVIVCRCEEVRAGDIRRYARLGCRGPNQTKAFGRCGMGPCQGRYCGLTVTEVLAEAHGVGPEAIGAYRIRAPLKPITLGELAAMAETNAAG